MSMVEKSKCQIQVFVLAHILATEKFYVLQRTAF